MQILSGLVGGLVFGIGLAVSGMTDPAVVLGFLDVTGVWNPALVFVLAGAVLVTFIGYRIVLQRTAPLFAPRFTLPTATAIDAELVVGAVVFGIGWGLAGYCPGPAIASISALDVGTLAFLAAMVIGMIGTRLVRTARPRPAAA